ncbi:MAG: FecR domain-containing protein [Leptolyngbyaceae bacterium]|nr:FecR domain-containing protein [Leptolyngbyaceae bacterium]
MKLKFFSCKRKRKRIGSSAHLPSRLLLSRWMSPDVAAWTPVRAPARTTSQRWITSLAIATTLAAVPVHSVRAQSSLQNFPLPQGERWLEVQHIDGSVTYHGDRQARPAQIGDRLLQLNQGIDTEIESGSILQLDSNIGTVRVAESTSLRVNRMAVLPDGGRVTSLVIRRGQARLQVRRFTHPSSNLEIETPAGVAAIRGTVFGLSVENTGKTGVATLTGAVEVSAQGVSVMVNPGFATSVIPGYPPTPPRRIDRQLIFDLGSVQRTSSRVILRGRVDPANAVWIEGEEVETDESGEFQTVLLNSPRRYFGTETLTVEVRNPLGERRVHPVAVPEF